MQRASRLPFVIRHLSFVILLTACSLVGTPTATPPTQPSLPTATPTSVLANSTPVPATQQVQVQTLRLWLPPQFAPDPDTPGGKVLQAQLAAFTQAQGWQVEVRVKKLAGQGGLLDALHSSLQVAPGVSPDLIVLDSSLLATEATTGTLQPLSQIAPEEVADVYPVALQSARHNDNLLAMPFAMDVLGFAYATGLYPLPPQSWADMKPEIGNTALPLNDPTGLLTLQQYVALGGKYLDDNNQLVLDKTILAQVLADYQNLAGIGTIPLESITATNTDDTWAIYRENRASSAAVFFSTFLQDRRKVSAAAFTALPTHNGLAATFARQWNYAMVASDPARQAATLELVRWLTTPDNLGAWSLAASVLPARSRAFAVWSEPGLAAVADHLLKVAQPEPPAATLAVLGPALNTAVQSVLTGQATPDQAAETAANNVAKH